jgi:hypothetical protein
MAAVAGGNAVIDDEMKEMARKAAAKANQVDDFNRNTPDYGLWPQVMKAAWEGKVEELERLLVEDPTCVGGTPDGSSGLSPLHVACHYDQEAAAIVLLKHGADVNADDGAGWTPMHHAAYDGYKHTGRASGSGPDSDPGPSLGTSTVRHHHSCSAAATTPASPAVRAPPTSSACPSRYHLLVRFLLERGANPFAQIRNGQFTSYTPRMLAKRGGEPGHHMAASKLRRAEEKAIAEKLGLAKK